MSAQWASILGALCVALGGAIGAWLSSRKPGSRENALIDQLQEELARARGLEREKVTALESEHEGMKRRMSRLESRELLWRQYVFALQAHINEGAPPPPPPFPTELLGFFDTAADR